MNAPRTLGALAKLDRAILTAGAWLKRAHVGTVLLSAAVVVVAAWRWLAPPDTKGGST